MYRTIFTILFAFCVVFNTVQAQQKREVNRSSAVSRTSPVYTMGIDQNNQKWVRNGLGTFKVVSPTAGQQADLPEGSFNAASLPGGNHDFVVDMATLQKMANLEFDEYNFITSSVFDAQRNELWFGTTLSGVIRCKVDGEKITSVKVLDAGNSKLRTVTVYEMVVDSKGWVWFATDDGLVRANGDDWKVVVKDFAFQKIKTDGTSIWMLSDGEICYLDANEELEFLENDPRSVAGEIKDIAVDNFGAVWVATRVIAVYNPFDQNWTSYAGPEAYTSEQARCLLVDKDGAIWVGTADKGLYSIGQSSAIAVRVIAETPVSCDGDGKDGNLAIEQLGGKAPFSYQWSSGGTLAALNGVGPGEYSVTVTDSDGKEGIGRLQLEDPRMTLTTNVLLPARANKSDGEAEVVAKGGKPPYSYLWDNGEKRDYAGKLTGGAHTVTVTDDRNCSATATVVMSEDILPLSMELNLAAELLCFGTQEAGLMTAVKGGKLPYNYKWSNGTTEERATKLGVGTYSVTITDAEGTTVSAEKTVSGPTQLTLTVDVERSATSGAADGKASAKADGGAGGYNYQWDNGSTGKSTDNLNAGTHSVVVTDKNGCSATAEFSITEDILPLAVTLDITQNNNCAGAKTAAVEARPKGGKSPYAYQWNASAGNKNSLTNLAAADYTVTITDAVGTTATAAVTLTDPAPLTANAKPLQPATTGEKNGKATVKAEGGSGKYTYKWSAGSTKEDAEGLATGNYVVTVTDEKGCSTTASVSIDENILPLTVELNQSGEIKCFGEKSVQLSALVTGGKPPYSYSYSNGLASETEQQVTGGEYSVTVSDSKGNTVSTKLVIASPTELTVSTKVNQSATTNAKDGRATASVSGGAGKYKFAWDTGETTAAAAKLGPGKHTVTVTDNNGCSVTSEVMITEDILTLAVKLEVQKGISCNAANDGEIRADISGGKPPFSYEWAGGTSANEVLKNLGPGTYTLVLKDAAGTKEQASISLKEPAPLSLSLTKRVLESYEGNRDGGSTAVVTGGTEPYSYLWTSDETEARSTRLSTGQQAVTVTDANGCTATESVEIKVRAFPELTYGQLQPGQIIQATSITFPADSVNLEPDIKNLLDEVHEFLAQNPKITVEVRGHTNNLPPDEYCDMLSTARAKAVADYVTSKGIASERVIYKGYGKRDPLFSNKSPDGRRRNQRVEFKILAL